LRRKVRRVPKLVRREVYERELEISERRAGDVAGGGAEDEPIVHEAKEENRIIITCDKNFGFSALPHGPPGIRKIL